MTGTDSAVCWYRDLVGDMQALTQRVSGLEVCTLRLLRACYAMSGTGLRACYAMSGRDLRACYAMSGTDVGCWGTRTRCTPSHSS
eukprot:2529004-Rhodomonas_salina.2